MAYWIKTVGSSILPYTQERHDSWNQQYVWFPGDNVSVTDGDRLFLYTGRPLRRLFAICTVTEAPSVSIGAHDGLRLRSPVFVHLTISDLLSSGVKAEEVFPLPSGRKLVSLRQNSHVRIESDDGIRLTTHLITALQRELARNSTRLTQRSLFGNEPPDEPRPHG